MDMGTYRDKENKCVWWLRSPGRAVNNVAVISINGDVHQEGNNITSPSNVGVYPVLHIKLESKAWFMAMEVLAEMRAMIQTPVTAREKEAKMTRIRKMTLYL